MFQTLFEERDKKITHLIKLGDCIGRSLRENVVLFSIDSANDLVTYLTESNNVISGNYTIGPDVILSNIEVQDADVFQDEESFDRMVENKIHSFVENIHYSSYSEADDSFDDILALWENRVKLGSLQEKVAIKASKLEAIENIMESDEVSKFLEIRPQIVEFLSENFDKITQVPEIKNAVVLSNSVSDAFNFRKLTLEELEERGSYILKEGTSESVYEMICRQELVKRELIESKKEFDVIWATNKHIKQLAGMIFEENDTLVPVLAEALREVPYLAMASKKSLFNTFSNCLSQVDGVGISESDIQGFASKIFEIKKEVKDMFIETISEKYGVNIQNLQEPVSFKSLVNTQIVIFESISRLAPKGSIIKQVTSDVAAALKTKHGVEAIDLNEAIYDMFCSAGYVEQLQEATAEKSGKVNLKRIAKDLGDARDLITNLRDKVADSQYNSDETTEDAKETKGEKASTAAPKKPAEAAPAPPASDDVAPEDGEASPEVPETKSEDEAVEDLASLENMVADIAAELGIKDEPQEETEETEK